MKTELKEKHKDKQKSEREKAKWKREIKERIKRKKSYGGDDYGVVMPLGMVNFSKMSGQEPPLEVYYTQDKTQEQFRRQNSLITQAEFLFYIQIQV